MFCRSEGSTWSKYLRELPARHTSVKDQEDLRTDVLTSDGIEAIDSNTAIEDYDGL